MIQDIEPHIFHNEFHQDKDVVPEERDTVFFIKGRTLLCRGEESKRLDFPSVKEVRDCGIPDAYLRYLFSITEGSVKKQYFLYMNPDGEIAFSEEEICHRLPSYHFEKVFITRSIHPKDDCFAASIAYHLFTWYRDSLYCGRCGTKTVFSRTERAKICPECGHIIYPRICPAVIVGVMKDDRILMTRYASREFRGNALVAGFTEIGETPEGTVRREVMEEVGLHVKNIRYYKSQPWGYALNLLMGFYCEVDDDVEEHIHLDEEELATARFIGRDDIGQEAMDVSLTADMIMHFKDVGQAKIIEELHLSHE